MPFYFNIKITLVSGAFVTEVLDAKCLDTFFLKIVKSHCADLVRNHPILLLLFSSYLDFLVTWWGKSCVWNLTEAKRRSGFCAVTFYPGRDIWYRGIPQLSSWEHKTCLSVLNSSHCSSLDMGKFHNLVYWCVYNRLKVNVSVFQHHKKAHGSVCLFLGEIWKGNSSVRHGTSFDYYLWRLHMFYSAFKGYHRLIMSSVQ